MRKWLRGWLGIKDQESQISNVEQKLMELNNKVTMGYLEWNDKYLFITNRITEVYEDTTKRSGGSRDSNSHMQIHDKLLSFLASIQTQIEAADENTRLQMASIKINLDKRTLKFQEIEQKIEQKINNLVEKLK